MILHRRFPSRLFGRGLVLVFAAGLQVWCQQAPASQERVAGHYRAGQEDMQAGRFAAAAAEFRKVLALRPDLVEARVNLGLAYHAQGDYSLAVSELAQAASERPDILPANLFLGLSYVKLGHPEKAISPLNRALTLDPSNREARRALANAELSEGDYGEAAAQVRRLAEAEADKANARFSLGHDYLGMSKLLTTALSTRFRNSAWSLRLAGDVLGERSLWNDAAFAYRRALQGDPLQPGLHSALGVALLRGGKTAEAESEFQAELSHHPFDSPALLGTAEVQMLKGAVQPAIGFIGQIWKFSPDLLAQSWLDFPLSDVPAGSARQMAARLAGMPSTAPRDFLRSTLLRVAGDTEGANQEHSIFENEVKSAPASSEKGAPPSRSACAEHHERLCLEFLRSEKLRSFPDDLRLGRTLLALHQDIAASEAFAAAFAQNQTSAEAVYWLNQAYLRLADNCFNQLTAAYPDSWRAHELRGESLHARQADKEAIAEYRAAEHLNPDDPGVHEELGELLLRQNSLADGKSELETALHLNPAAPRSLFLLGNLYVSQREPEKGIPYLKAALRYDPTLLEARPALGKAYLKVGKPDLAAVQLERSTALDRYGDLHYLLYQAYREEGKPQLASEALARSQELRRRSAADDQAKIRPADQE